MSKATRGKIVKLQRIKRRSASKPSLTQTQSRYRFKPGFAEKVKDHALKAYRKKRGKDFELGGATVLRSLEFVEASAEILPCVNTETGRRTTAPVIRLTELAKLLDTSYQTIWRWSSETDLLPRPILTESSQGRERPVYHLEEVKIIIRAVGEHLNEFAYYRKNHTGTRDRIFSEIETIRKANYGVPNGDQTNRQSAREKGNRRREGHGNH